MRAQFSRSAGDVRQAAKGTIGGMEIDQTGETVRGKTVLVTGGARRLGRDIALQMASAGADVAITYRTSKQDAMETIREVEASGVRGWAVECDVRREASVGKAVKTVG